MLYGAKGCCSTIDNRDYGDEAISIYGTSDSIIENCISENEANGYQIHGIASPLDPTRARRPQQPHPRQHLVRGRRAGRS